MSSRLPLRLAAGWLLAALFARGAEPAANDARAVANLTAFTRVYGYVRFFSPSDEAAAVDWDKVGILGAEATRDAANDADLRTALLQFFQPLAPGLRLTDSIAPAATPAAATDARLTFWQHAGLNLTGKPNIYTQHRVIADREKGERAPVFKPATPPAPIRKIIAPGLVLELPLALPVDAEGLTSRLPSPEFIQLLGRLNALDLTKLTSADWRLRVAGVVSVWNIFQHFHPYLDNAGVDWDEGLAPALAQALHDQTANDYYATLSELVARSHDGHGFVYGRRHTFGGVPIRVSVVEDVLVVTAVADGAPFQRGDIITRLDGVPALDGLRERERFTSGSPHLRRFRALNQYGEGPLGSTAHFEVTRAGRTEKVDFVRTEDHRGYFFNRYSEFTFPAFTEVRPGIFYINLYELDAPGLEAKLPQLAGARGVIFDWRWGGHMVAENAKQIQPHADIIPHLISQPIQASPMMIPLITAPDRIGWTYRTSTWPVKPKAPRLSGRVVFINEPSVVSYGETCMAMIADYHLATLVGAPTAGCNGNVNFISLPDSFRVMWTGMDVRKHDGSAFFGVGFVPDYPVTRTLRAVQEGRDEYLERAIAVIEQAAPATR